MDDMLLSKRTLVLLSAIIAIVYSLASIFCIYLKSNNITDLTANNSSFSSAISSDTSKNNTSNTSNTSTTNSSVSNTLSEITSAENNSSNNSSVSSSDISTSESSTSSTTSSTVQSNTSSKEEAVKPPVSKPFTSAVWYAFYELDFRDLTEEQFKEKINKMFDDAVTLKSDAVICHVRSHADAFYYSEYFPMSQYVSGEQGKKSDYDPLKYMVSAAHERNLKFHAWINPYRVATSNDLSLLAENNPAKKWLNDENTENDRNVIIWGNGIYFNPARTEVRTLVLNGIKEILNNYDVDGIHIDDYFYPEVPTISEDFDGIEYNAYKSTTRNPLTIEDWRRANVNALVTSIYSAVKQHNNVLFGVSPSCHISTDHTDKNYTTLFADIAKWMSSDGYVDYIAPQLYFSYDYPLDEFKFNNLLRQWYNMPRKQTVKLFIGIAAYKINPDEADTNSWLTEDDILARQATDSKNIGCDGIFIYNYSSIMDNSKIVTRQRNNLINALKILK